MTSSRGGVLVVDDDEMIRYLLRMRLGQANVHPDEAETGAAALEAIRTAATPHAVIVADIQLVDMPNGIFIEKALEARGGSPLIIIALSGDLKRGRALEERFGEQVLFVEKPFDGDALVELILRHLSGVKKKKKKRPAERKASPVLSEHAIGEGEANEARPRSRQTTHLNGAPTSGCRTLIVEDSKELVFILKHRLRAEGIESIVARSLSEARQMVSAVKPALVILDLALPDGSGEDFLRELRAREETKAIPVIVLTAMAEKERIERCFIAGANAFLPKPVSKTDLMASVRLLLAGK